MSTVSLLLWLLLVTVCFMHTTSASESDDTASVDTDDIIEDICAEEGFTEAQCELLEQSVEMAIEAGTSGEELMNLITTLVTMINNGELLASENEDAECSLNSAIVAAGRDVLDQFVVVNNAGDDTTVSIDFLDLVNGNEMSGTDFFMTYNMVAATLTPDGETLYVITRSSTTDLLFEVDVEDILSKAEDPNSELRMNQIGILTGAAPTFQYIVSGNEDRLFGIVSTTLSQIDIENVDDTTNFIPALPVAAIPSSTPNSPMTFNPATGTFFAIINGDELYSISPTCDGSGNTQLDDNIAEDANACGDGDITSIAFVEANNPDLGTVFQVLCQGAGGAPRLGLLSFNNGEASIVTSTELEGGFSNAFRAVIPLNTDLSDGCQADSFENSNLLSNSAESNDDDSELPTCM